MNDAKSFLRRKPLIAAFLLTFLVVLISLPEPGLADGKMVKAIYFFEDGKSISPEEVISLTPGIQYVLQARALYEDGTYSVINTEAHWNSSNPKAIAILDNSFGLLETVAEGASIVTVSYMGKTVSVKFSVSPAVSLTASLDGNTSHRNVRMENGKLVMEKGSAASIFVNAVLADGTKKEVTHITNFKQEDPEVVLITYGSYPAVRYNQLIALEEGNTTVTFTLNDAKTSLDVVVVPKNKNNSVQDLDAAVSFNDPGLEDAVRATIKKPVGEITLADMAKLTELICYAWDLTGLEHATNLKKLTLQCNFMLRDISSLARLTNLEELKISPPPAGGWGELIDLTPLANLTNLRKAVLYGKFSDISPLAKLVNLRELRLFSNQVSDVSVLADLKNLEAFSLNGAPVTPVPKVSVKINGEIQTYDQPPVILNDRTLVPLRGIFEALGAVVSWDEKNRTVTATKDGNMIKLTIGSKIALKNGLTINLDQPPQLINDRTMVPVRFVSEALGAEVDWDETTRTVSITQF